MAEFVYYQLVHFASTIWLGVGLNCGYDCIRVFRRVCKHKKMWTINLEDLLFGVVMGFMLFKKAWELEDGEVRVSLFLGAILGAVIYHYSISRIFVKYTSKIVTIVLKIVLFPLKKIIGWIKILIVNIRKTLLSVFKGDNNGNTKKSNRVSKESRVKREKTASF